MARLTSEGCRVRQNRLLELLARERFDAAIISDVRDIYYFTGTLVPNDLPAILVVEADGRSLCLLPAEHEIQGVDRVVQYEWNHRGTRHPDILAQMIRAMNGIWPTSSCAWLGVQRNSLLERVRQAIPQDVDCESIALDEAIADMQSRKDADEIELIRASIRANLAAYAAVAEAIRPGVNELDILSAGRRGATREAGEKVFHDGDYQSASYNGPARDRLIQSGELYIVDAWTCYRGYWSDMSRTYVVGEAPSDEQQKLFEHIRWVQDQVPGLLRPGVDGMEVYRALDEMIRQHPPLADEGLVHHGGHAIGLRAHEMPDINLRRGGQLELGNVICVEPGGYFPEARYGVRLENMYLVTNTGCEDLCPGDIKLAICR